MYSMIQKLVSCGRDPACPLPLWRGFLLIPLILVCFALSAQAAPQALPSPSPDGCYPGFTTAEGCHALFHLTTGAGNTAVGWYSLSFNPTASSNTVVGVGARALIIPATNTPVGAGALFL